MEPPKVSSPNARPLRRLQVMASLILAGEVIFSLPFHVVRFFRPTVLRAFSLTNTQLGSTHAIYGVLTMICYFPGGPLADRFGARRLLAVSLTSTALGGFCFASRPQLAGLHLVFGFWG